MSLLLPATLLAIAFALADQPAVKTDHDRIQGTWVVTRVESGGEVLKEGLVYERLKTMKLTFKGDGLTNSNKPDFKGTFTLDPEKKPATLLMRMSGNNRSEARAGLYELADDTLRLCGLPIPTEEFPKEFTSKDGQLIITLRREGKKPEK